MPSQKRLADYLGLSTRQIRRHIAAGMPSRDEELAAAWYQDHIRPLGATEPDPTATALVEMIDALRDSLFHFGPPSMTATSTSAIVADVIGLAADQILTILPTVDLTAVREAIASDVATLRSLTTEQKKAADERARRRWKQRGEPQKMFPLIDS